MMNLKLQPSNVADQAMTLRTLSGQYAELRPEARPQRSARVFSITGGKGGVGKTVVTTNLALALARLGQRVLIIDADLGLANIDVMFGLDPAYHLGHFFAGERGLEEILVEGPQGIRILPAGSGLQSFTRLSNEQKRRFIDEIDPLHDAFDVVLIDTEAGISENVTYFNTAAHEILVITAPEPTAITDAYALMKLLSQRFNEKRFKLIVNSVQNEAEGLEVYRRLTMVSSRHLDIAIDYLGVIPYDRRVHDSVARQQAMVEFLPQSPPSLAFASIARHLAALAGGAPPKGSNQFFWSRLLSYGREEES